jgi:hypothetical protein
LKNEYYFLSKAYPDKEPPETRSSVIQIVDFPELEKFYEAISKNIGVRLEIPLAHIALFTTSTNEDTRTRGVGLCSKEEFFHCIPIPYSYDIRMRGNSIGHELLHMQYVGCDCE